MRGFGRLSLCLALGLLAGPAQGNDSQAAIGIGGLALTRSDAISMDSEDLYISKNEVRVRYRFTNRTDSDVVTLISFPVPMLPDGIEGDYHDTAMPDYTALEFRTTIDGKHARLDYVERAEVAGRDVTALISALGWPLRWFEGADDPLPFIERLTPAQKADYLRDGLLKRSKYDASQLIPAWNLVTHAIRRQAFPAGKTIEVTHRYVPFAGGSVGGGFDGRARRRDEFGWRQRKFCPDAGFLSAFDRQYAIRRARAPDQMYYTEVWLSYILRTGSNWRGPIGDFRLVVDKGSPDSLVSFCMEGVTKISPTQFEVRRQNFKPLRDLDIVIVEFVQPN